MHIPTLAAEVIFKIGNFAITNTMINVWLAMIIFLVLGIYITKKINLRPGKFQNGAEFFLEGLMGYFDQVTGNRKKTLRFMPLVGSIFFFIFPGPRLLILFIIFSSSFYQ